MSLEDSINLLETHNAWRRGDESIEQHNPTDIGMAIDDVIKAAKKYQYAMNVLHEIAYPVPPANGKPRRTKESRHAMAILMFLESM